MSSTFEGRPAAPGVAVAPAFLVSESTVAHDSIPQTRSGSVESEQERLDAALRRAEAELRELGQRVAAVAGEEEGDIFEAHAEFAADPELASQAYASIRAGASAEWAAIQAFETFRELLAASESEYLAARAADLDDVRERVLAILLGRPTGVPVPRQRSVIVARELTPSQTAGLPREAIAAVATETGSPTSHAAILARSLGIPAVVACAGLLADVVEGTPVAVDGRAGTVIVSPDEEQLETIEERMREEGKRRAELTALREEPGRTADGRRVELAANIGSPEDLPVAVEAGAEGSGLVRTEFLFLGRRSAPGIDEQAAAYAEILKAFPGERVVFRTMDVGADKPLAFVAREAEENPALGVRGIRLSFEMPAMFGDQLRALLRARAALSGGPCGRLAIMFPMVSTGSEMGRALGFVSRAADEEGVDATGIEVGAMIEVPSAAIGARRIARHADFVSIGTNDLLQYLFAADRLNRFVAGIPDICEPEVLSLIGTVVEAVHAQDAWVGVCGEAASDPTVAAALVGLGVDELSMTRVAIPDVKDALRKVSHEQCRTAVTAAIERAADGDEARRLLEEHLDITT